MGCFSRVAAFFSRLGLACTGRSEREIGVGIVSEYDKMDRKEKIKRWIARKMSRWLLPVEEALKCLD